MSKRTGTFKKKKKPRLKHTACKRGTRVIIYTRDKERVDDIFWDRKQGTIFLKKYGKIHKKNIARFIIPRAQSKKLYAKTKGNR